MPQKGTKCTKNALFSLCILCLFVAKTYSYLNAINGSTFAARRAGM